MSSTKTISKLGSYAIVAVAVCLAVAIIFDGTGILGLIGLGLAIGVILAGIVLWL